MMELALLSQKLESRFDICSPDFSEPLVGVDSMDAFDFVMVQQQGPYEAPVHCPRASRDRNCKPVNFCSL